MDEAIASLLARVSDQDNLSEPRLSLVEAGDAAVPPILTALVRCASGSGPERWWDGAPRLCEVLARIGTDEAKRSLVRVLNTDSSIVEWDRIRASAARAIGELGDPSLISELEAASNEPHAPTLAIQDAIGALGGSTDETPATVIERGRQLMPGNAIGHFAARAEAASNWPAGDRAYFYSAWAGKINVILGREAALPYYAAAVVADPNPENAAWSHAFWGMSPSPETAAELAATHPLPAEPVKADASALVAALQDPSDVVRMNAAEALGELGDRAAVSGLSRALSEGEYPVRLRAAGALSQLGDESATDVLIAATHDPNYRVVEEAARALGEIGSASATTRLEELLTYTYDAESDPDFKPELHSGDAPKLYSEQVRQIAREALDRLRARSDPDPSQEQDESERLES